MDIREKKTKRSIYNAFLELRSKKALEKITVKELSNLAEISKATFYLHYKDIFDLSEQLQKKVISDILGYISDPKVILFDSQKFIKEILEGFYANQTIMDILFSDAQFSMLPEFIESEIKKIIFTEFPELKNDAVTNIRLTYQIMGGFLTYTKNHKQFGHDSVTKVIDDISKTIDIYFYKNTISPSSH